LRPLCGHFLQLPQQPVAFLQNRQRITIDGNAAHLFPSPAAEIAADVVGLAGERALLARARARAGSGEAQRALHLVDFVLDGGGRAFAGEALALKAELLAARAAAEPSYIARSILENGAAAAAAAAGDEAH